MGGVHSNSVVIVGAGPAGLVAALACQKAGLVPVVADTSPPASGRAAAGRSAALFNRSVSFLRELDVWQTCADGAAPLRSLQLIDDTGRLLRAPDCLFHASEIGEEAFGHNILNTDLIRCLREQAEKRSIQLIDTGRLLSLEKHGADVCLCFEAGQQLHAPLAVAADGRMSATREAAGIRSLTWSYGQMAIAGSFSHERPHHERCIEFHRRTGPFTLIPLPGRRSSYVWSEREAEAKRLLSLGLEEFAHAAGEASRYVLGRLSGFSERAGFALSTLTVREYGRGRVALVGEAAHAAPPIGAQGLNLGFRDVQTLAALLGAALNRGEDIGGEELLKSYSAARRRDIVSRTLSLDFLNRSLLSGFLPMQAARGAGLYALQSVGPLRRAFMRRGIAPAHLS
jgi:2-octaprenyl-6-methoxyphenol hydroxylase